MARYAWLSHSYTGCSWRRDVFHDAIRRNTYKEIFKPIMVNIMFVTAIVALSAFFSYFFPNAEEMQAYLSIATACFAFATILSMMEKD